MGIFPQSLKVFKHKSIFVKALIFFNLFILLAIIAFGYFSYTKSSTLLLDEVIKSNNSYMEQARDNIDKTLVSLDNLTFQISLQSQIRRALYLSESTWDLDQLLFHNIIGYLKSVKLSNTIISDIWLQFYRYPVVLNYESKYPREYYYKEIYNTEPPLNWSEIRGDHLSLTPLGRYETVSYGVPSSDITFMRTVPLSELTPMGVLYVNIKTEEFSNRIQSGSDPYPAFVYAVGEDGRVIFNSAIRSEQDQLIHSVKDTITEKVRVMGTQEGNLQQSISGVTYQIVFTSSKINSWKYISVVPTAFITEKANQIRQFTFIAALVCLAGGIIMSYFLINRIYRPINNMVGYIQLFVRKPPSTQGSGKEDELGFIDRFINFVYYENQNLRESFEKSLPALRQKYLYDIIEGRVPSDKLQAIAEEIQMNFIYDAFQVVVFETVDFSLEDIISPYSPDALEIINGIASEMGDGHLTVQSIRKRNDKIISLLNLDYRIQNPEVISDFIRKVISHFEQEYAKTFTVGVGKPYLQSEEVPLSYVEALSALQYKMVKGQGSVIFVDEVRKLPARSFIYSMETEKQIINCVKTGSMDALNKQLLALWGESLKEEELTPERITNLFHALIGTAIRAIYEVQSTTEEIFGDSFDLYKGINSQAGLQDKKAFIESTFRSISGWIHDKKQGQYSKLFEQIQDYVENNYQHDLSLTILGEKIGLSPSYLSSIFKEVTGLNFVDYINTRRVEQAKLLLRQTNDTVIEITDKVGFTNSNTFIRVFKRYEGITPGQFRQMHVKETNS